MFKTIKRFSGTANFSYGEDFALVNFLCSRMSKSMFASYKKIVSKSTKYTNCSSDFSSSFACSFKEFEDSVELDFLYRSRISYDV